jgi:hypothetical protein
MRDFRGSTLFYIDFIIFKIILELIFDHFEVDFGVLVDFLSYVE